MFKNRKKKKKKHVSPRERRRRRRALDRASKILEELEEIAREDRAAGRAPAGSLKDARNFPEILKRREDARRRESYDSDLIML